jgi:GNAT superfamily N-acetyltransferase
VTPWSSEPLGEQHDLTRFACGNDTLDAWLREHALRAHRAGVSNTTVWTASTDNVVVAYHAIAPTQLARADLPSRSLSAGYSTLPGFLVGRLALDRSLQGQGLGGQLLLDALERILAASELAGGRLIAVDAIDDAAERFYIHHGFQPIAGTPRRVMKIATARAALERPED